MAIGPDPSKGEKRGHAKGIVAFGDMATGVFAAGGLARGVVAFGGLAIGLASFGGLGIGLILALGGAAAGGVAIGGGAAGVYAMGGRRRRNTRAVDERNAIPTRSISSAAPSSGGPNSISWRRTACRNAVTAPRLVSLSRL